MTDTEHTPGKDDHRGPLTAQEVNLLWHKLRVAQTRIVELEARLYGTEYTKYDRIEAYGLRVTDLEDEVQALKSAQRPRPMDEAPKDGTRILMLYVSAWHHDKDIVWGWMWEQPPHGWLPLPDQDEKSA